MHPTLLVMTSPQLFADTQAAFADAAFFGLNPAFVHFFNQSVIPSEDASGQVRFIDSYILYKASIIILPLITLNIYNVEDGSPTRSLGCALYGHRLSRTYIHSQHTRSNCGCSLQLD